MSRGRLTLSLTAVYAALCLYYRGNPMLLPMTILPLAAHELSHLLALRLLGMRVTDFRLEPRGLCIRYEGDGAERKQIVCALAGPLGGMAFAFFAGRTEIAWLQDSAGLSLVLSAFNLLPILPLDGGRVFLALCRLSMEERSAEGLYRAVSGALLALLLICGVGFAAWKKATAPLAAAIWLLLFQNEEEGLVKNKEII